MKNLQSDAVPLVRLWGFKHSPNGHSPTMMKGLQNCIIHTEGNLAIYHKITNTNNIFGNVAHIQNNLCTIPFTAAQSVTVKKQKQLNLIRCSITT